MKFYNFNFCSFQVELQIVIVIVIVDRFAAAVVLLFSLYFHFPFIHKIGIYFWRSACESAYDFLYFLYFLARAFTTISFSIFS